MALSANDTIKLRMYNRALKSIGQNPITTFAAPAGGTGTPVSNEASGLLEEIVAELFGDDWFFTRHRAELTLIYKLTTVAAPAVSEWAAGATLTGATSGVTCTVVEKLSSTEYLVTEPSDDWTDGETISDGTNTAVLDESTDESIDFGSYDYRYLIPSGSDNIIGLIDLDSDEVRYKHQPEGRYILCNQTEAYLLYNRYLGYEGSATVCDATLFPGWFRKLVSAVIADMLSPNTTQNARIRPKVESELKDAWLHAKEMNGMQFFESKKKGNRNWSQGAARELETM